MPVSLSSAGQAALVNPLFGTSPFAQANFTSPTGPFPADPNAAVAQLMSAGTKSLIFPGDLATTKYWMSFGAFEYIKASWNAVGQSQMVGTIFLPLAQQLVDSATVSYEMPETGIVGGAIMSGTSGAPTTGMGMFKTATEAATSVGIGLTNSLGASVLGVLGQGNPGAAIQAKTGRTINQYMTVLLKGPSYKVREFSWVFSPRNQAESTALEQVLWAFKNAQAPTIASEATNAFYGWPNIFQIRFQMGAQDTSTPSQMGLRLFDMLPSVLNDLVVDYTPAGAPSFYGKTSAPTFVKVMMRFTELELWLRNQYRNSQGGGVWDPNVSSPAPVFLVGSGGGAGLPGAGSPL